MSGPKADARHLRIFVRQLDQKLVDLAEKPRHIQMETEVGYRLRTHAESPEHPEA